MTTNGTTELELPPAIRVQSRGTTCSLVLAIWHPARVAADSRPSLRECSCAFCIRVGWSAAQELKKRPWSLGIAANARNSPACAAARASLDPRSTAAFRAACGLGLGVVRWMTWAWARAYACQSRPVPAAPASWAAGFAEKPWRQVVPPVPDSL